MLEENVLSRALTSQLVSVAEPASYKNTIVFYAFIHRGSLCLLVQVFRAFQSVTVWTSRLNCRVLSICLFALGARRLLLYVILDCVICRIPLGLH